MESTLAIAIEKLQARNFSAPDEVRMFEKGKVELITTDGVTFGRMTLLPGWRWSTCVKPIAQTESCEHAHLQYQISGRMHVVMDDGSEKDFGPGDIVSIPPGHDAWVIGNEPVVGIDIAGMAEYARPKFR